MGALRLNLMQSPGRTATARPVLLLSGGGRVTFTAMRVPPVPGTSKEILAAYDRELRWAPENIGHTTINAVTPSFWSASRRIWLADVVAWAALVAFAAALLVGRVRTRRWRPGSAVGDKDWFGRQTLCFNLAPRPCVIMRPGERVHAGIQGVGKLRDEEIDALVVDHGTWVPDGFVRVAAVSSSAFVAQRR